MAAAVRDARRRTRHGTSPDATVPLGQMNMTRPLPKLARPPVRSAPRGAWMRLAAVVCVLAADSLEDALEIANDSLYGLSSSIYTRDANVAFRAFSELDNGITYVNAPTIGAEAHLPFGGVKQTGNGHREGGWQVYEFYSETKVGYADFSGTLQRAQIDNYLGTPD